MSPFLRAMIIVVSLLFQFSSMEARAQGRVLINEYLAWPGNGCPPTSEFIELYNFGPGPADISCYIVTDGDFAITIPANTILAPGQYFVLAGQDILAAGCANISRDIRADLNWNNCNCTSGIIPTTGEGLLSDGGNAGEQVVLLDKGLNIIDAIARVPEPSARITTKASGSCPPRVFDLDDRSIRYEIVGESQGRNNSFARKVNGGCGWLKNTQQSAGFENNTKGYIPQFYSTLSVVNPLSCNEKGYVVAHILNADYSKVFPMRYTLSRDIDSNGMYNEADHYKTGYDSVASNIEIKDLESGLYRVIIETQDGCDLQALDFNILDCNAVILAGAFKSFKLYRTSGNSFLQWELNADMKFASLEIQQSIPGKPFTTLYHLTGQATSVQKNFTVQNSQAGTQYRIKLIDQGGKFYYSAILRSGIETNITESMKVSSRSSSSIAIEINSTMNRLALLRMIDAMGRVYYQKDIQVKRGTNQFYIDADKLNTGIYLVQWIDPTNNSGQTIRFFNNRN